jgi:hypothetical protein
MPVISFIPSSGITLYRQSDPGDIRAFTRTSQQAFRRKAGLDARLCILHLCDLVKPHQPTDKASLRSVKYPLNSSAILPSVSATIVQINE